MKLHRKRKARLDLISLEVKRRKKKRGGGGRGLADAPGQVGETPRRLRERKNLCRSYQEGGGGGGGGKPYLYQGKKKKGLKKKEVVVPKTEPGKGGHLPPLLGK